MGCELCLSKAATKQLLQRKTSCNHVPSKEIKHLLYLFSDLLPIYVNQYWFCIYCGCIKLYFQEILFRKPVSSMKKNIMVGCRYLKFRKPRVCKMYYWILFTLEHSHFICYSLIICLVVFFLSTYHVSGMC